MPRTIGAKNTSNYKYELIDDNQKIKKLYKSMVEIADEYEVNILSIYRLVKRQTTQGKFKNIKLLKVNIPVFKKIETEQTQTF